MLGEIAHPTDPEAIVLRMSVGGGFVPVEIAFMENPTFTLYGNNLAIFRPAAELESMADPLEAFACQLLTPEQVDELLIFALEEGGLADADELYLDPFIADAPNTTFTIDADDTQKSVMVQALGFNDQAPDPDARAQFQALADVLADFQTEGDVSQPYEVPLYRAMLTAAWPEIEGSVATWPWEDIAVDAFGDDPAEFVTLTPEQVADVASTPSGGQAFIILETPDGSRWSLTISPILPATR